MEYTTDREQLIFLLLLVRGSLALALSLALFLSFSGSLSFLLVSTGPDRSSSRILQ